MGNSPNKHVTDFTNSEAFKKLPQSEQEHLTKLFWNCGIQGEARTYLEQMLQKLCEIGLPITIEKANRFCNLNRHEQGELEVDELIEALLEDDDDGHPNYEKLMKEFQKLDTNKDGFLSMEELRDGLTRGGYPLEKKTIQTLFKQLDKNNDGRVSYMEFIALLS